MLKKCYEIICMFFFISVFISNQLAIAEDIKKKVPHISAQKAMALYKTGKIILLDVHPSKNNMSSIVGAHYVSAKKIDKVKLKFPRNILVGVF